MHNLNGPSPSAEVFFSPRDTHVVAGGGHSLQHKFQMYVGLTRNNGSVEGVLVVQYRQLRRVPCKHGRTRSAANKIYQGKHTPEITPQRKADAVE